MGTRFVVSCLIVLVVAALLVGMYSQTTQRRNRDGSVVRYGQVTHNRRVGGVTQAQVLANLGREDHWIGTGCGGWSLPNSPTRPG